MKNGQNIISIAEFISNDEFLDFRDYEEKSVNKILL